MEASLADRKLTRDELIKLALPSLLDAVRKHFLARPNELELTYSYDDNGSVVLAYSLAGMMMARRSEFEEYIRSDYEAEWFTKYAHLVLAGNEAWPETAARKLTDDELSAKLRKMR